MKYIAPLVVCAVLAPCVVAADPMVVHSAARALFDDLPDHQVVDDLNAACGGGKNAHPRIAFCSTRNMIFSGRDAHRHPAASYEMAHVLGHAIQVRHGVADVALREIRSRPDEEEALRAMVTGQVECIAGVLLAQSGLGQVRLAQAYPQEPFTDAHWGRDPINSGPRVSIGMEVRQAWVDTGYRAGDFAACSVGEMPSDLIVEALR